MSVFDFFPTLETPRLILRRIEDADAADLFAVFSDAAVTEHYDLYTFEELDEAYDLVEYFEESYQQERQIRWGIARREDGRVIGTCGFVALYEHRGEIGYELGSAYWGQGYMREALQAVLKLGFETLELNRIEAMVLPQNRASAALLRKLGFTEEGTLREYDYFKEQYQDLRCFSLLRREFEPREPNRPDRSV